jgi:hypothetical protein
LTNPQGAAQGPEATAKQGLLAQGPAKKSHQKCHRNDIIAEEPATDRRYTSQQHQRRWVGAFWEIFGDFFDEYLLVFLNSPCIETSKNALKKSEKTTWNFSYFFVKHFRHVHHVLLFF